MKNLGIFLLLLKAHLAFGDVRLDGLTGVSRFVINQQDGSWTVYGGIQGPNAAAYSTFNCSTSGTCNTCVGTTDGGVGDGPCNPVGVFADTQITFIATATNPPANARWLLCNGTQELAATTNLLTSLSVTWGTICSAYSGGSASCTTNGTTSTLSFGAGADCSNLGTNKVSLRFSSRTVDPSNSKTYADCPPGTAAGLYGACHFSLFPGDKKTFLVDDLFIVGNSFPAVEGGPSGITHENIFFFYLEKLVGEADGDAFNRITTNTVNGTSNAVMTATLAVASNSELTGSFIDGLDNDRSYCFKMASQDSAYNVELISPNSLCSSGTATCTDVCVTPSEVMGILSDKKCFIATAAFGSEMNQKVQLLRNFRNQFLAPHWLGRKLVKTYYKLSPPLAQWISKHEGARIMARSILWPLIYWAELSLKFGWIFLILSFFSLSLIVFWIQRNRRRAL